ncbi:BTB domain-containing protein, variant 2 [Balamuthia mandrillaris]
MFKKKKPLKDKEKEESDETKEWIRRVVADEVNRRMAEEHHRNEDLWEARIRAKEAEIEERQQRRECEMEERSKAALQRLENELQEVITTTRTLSQQLQQSHQEMMAEEEERHRHWKGLRQNLDALVQQLHEEGRKQSTSLQERLNMAEHISQVMLQTVDNHVETWMQVFGNERKKGDETEKIENEKEEESEEMVLLNVGGTKFQTFVSTLQRHPDTMLGTMFNPRNASLRRKIDPLSSSSLPEYFFDRDSAAFAAVLAYYRSGGNAPPEKPLSVGSQLWTQELKYWGFPLLQDRNPTLGAEVTTEVKKHHMSTLRLTERLYQHLVELLRDVLQEWKAEKKIKRKFNEEVSIRLFKSEDYIQNNMKSLQGVLKNDAGTNVFVRCHKGKKVAPLN